MNAPGNRFQTILFDLDGTLIDHFNVIFRCYEHALETLGCTVPSRKVLRNTVGGSMEITMKHFVDENRLLEAIRLFREHFDKIYLEDIALTPGVEWILAGLHERDKKLAVFTNKQGPGSRNITRHLELDAWLDAVIGAHDTPHFKPSAAFSRHALETLEATPDETCLVGDSVFDVQAAHNGGFPCFAVATGTHSRAELEAAGAAGVYEDLFELGRDVFGLDPARTGEYRAPPRTLNTEP